jgi:hypothetical protein
MASSSTSSTTSTTARRLRARSHLEWGRLEHEVRSVRRDPAGTMSARAARLIANAQELIASAS